jgi:dipeptidyl aminopeptidase/acylaminoacyl peptidase
MIAAVLAATFGLADLGRVASLPSAAISADAKRIAYVVETADLPHNRYVDRLRLIVRASRRDTAPRLAHISYDGLAFSPDGSRLGYLADDKNGTTQVYAYDLRAGRERALTTGDEDVEEFSWRPDGREIAFLRRDEKKKPTGEAVFRDGFEVTDNAYLATSAARPLRLWTTSSTGGPPSRLTSGTWSVADTVPAWTPDGSTLCYLHAPDGVRADQSRAFVECTNAANGQTHALTGRGAYEDEPRISPDGRNLAYLSQRDGDPMNATDAFVARIDGSADRDATATLDRHVSALAWLPTGELVVKVYDGTTGPLYRVARDGSAHRLPLGPVVDASGLDAASVARDGTLVFTGTQAARPQELYLLASGATAPVRLTGINDAIAAKRLGAVKEFAWAGPDGRRLVGVLTFPPGYDARRLYPMAMRIHGGPTETSLAAFDPFYQYAAARGYVVFAPNYRGSSDDGSAFERAIVGDASIGPGDDVISGVRALVAARIVDPKRLGVSGWSYGGQMTSWMISHYPDFAAAVTGAGVHDLVVDYAIADDLDADADAFRGSPYAGDALDRWRAQSPITFFKAIHTPTLILGNVYDVRVPIVESYELYHALRDNGVPVRFVAYPSTGHLPQGPVRTADVYRRWLDWFDRYVKR